jgi:hypothetical protein
VSKAGSPYAQALEPSHAQRWSARPSTARAASRRGLRQRGVRVARAGDVLAAGAECHRAGRLRDEVAGPGSENVDTEHPVFVSASALTCPSVCPRARARLLARNGKTPFR